MSRKAVLASWYDFAMEAEILFIMLLALIVLGPRRLPEIGRQIGKALAELRRAKYEFTRQIEEEISKIEEEEALASTRKALEAVRDPAGVLLAADAGESAATTTSENKILPPAGTIRFNGHVTETEAAEPEIRSEAATAQD
jgi:sec-independent protein translocase protein TatB